MLFLCAGAGQQGAISHDPLLWISCLTEPCSLQEEALKMIENFHQQLTSGEADFATLASKESHCSSAKRGGDLGKFEPGTMMPAFEEATYALKVMGCAAVVCVGVVVNWALVHGREHLLWGLTGVCSACSLVAASEDHSQFRCSPTSSAADWGAEWPSLH